MEFLQVIWFFLIVVLLLGYSVLDGFDLGVGILAPFMSKDDSDKRVLFNAVGPFWDGNEVWLLTGGGALFAAFPSVYATVFSGFYLALMLVLFALIFRAVSLEFWLYDEGNRGFWFWSFVLGSVLPTLLFGVALGNLMVGIPLNSNFDFTGNFFTLLRPFPLLTGLLGLVAIIIQGGAFAAMKAEGGLQERARKIVSNVSLLYLAFFVPVLGWGIGQFKDARVRVSTWVSVALFLAAWWMLREFVKRKADARVFVMSSLSILALWGMIASVMFPNLVRASNDAALNMTVYNSSSSQLSLTVMLVIALIGMPLVIAYSIYVYRAFKGKVRLSEL